MEYNAFDLRTRCWTCRIDSGVCQIFFCIAIAQFLRPVKKKAHIYLMNINLSCSIGTFVHRNYVYERIINKNFQCQILITQEVRSFLHILISNNLFSFCFRILFTFNLKPLSLVMIRPLVVHLAIMDKYLAPF